MIISLDDKGQNTFKFLNYYFKVDCVRCLCRKSALDTVYSQIDISVSAIITLLIPCYVRYKLYLIQQGMI
jgi:hypothetical protein